MGRKRNYNAPLPAPPSLDRGDPEVMKRAAAAGKARATRENTAKGKRYAEASAKHQKLVTRHASGQLFDAFDLTPPAPPEMTPAYSADFMMSQRERIRAEYPAFARKMRELQARHTREHLCEILEIVGVEEFHRVLRDVFEKEHPNIENRIAVALLKVKRRRDTPFTEQMEVVLAILEVWEGEPPTCCEMNRRSGDGLTRDEMWHALDKLTSVDLVTIHAGRPCSLCDQTFEATWRATNRKGESP